MLKNVNFENAENTFRGFQEEVSFVKPNIFSWKRGTPSLGSRNEKNMLFWNILAHFPKKKVLKNANFGKTKKTFRGGHEEVTFAKPNMCTSKRATSTLCTINYQKTDFLAHLSTCSKKNFKKIWFSGNQKIPCLDSPRRTYLPNQN